MLRRKALIDIDGVLALPHEAAIANIRARGIHIEESMLTQWDWTACVPGLTEQVMCEVWEQVIKSDDVPCCPVMKANLQALWDLGYDLHLVTARTGPMRTHTHQWLWRHEIPMDTLQFIPSEQKWAYAKNSGIQISIEDNRETAIDLAEKAGCRSILIAFPWNEVEPKDWPEGLYRAPRCDVRAHILGLHEIIEKARIRRILLEQYA